MATTAVFYAHYCTFILDTIIEIQRRFSKKNTCRIAENKFSVCFSST